MCINKKIGMNPQSPSRLKIWCKRLGYSLLAILLFIGVIYALGWYSDWKEQRQLDEMLAELDRNEPGWRWKDFLPTPLEPGQENGAVRFIEFGKTIDLKTLEHPHENYEESQNLRDRPNLLQPPTIGKWYGDLLARTHEQQKNVRNLVGLKQGLVPYKKPRPECSKVISWKDQLEEPVGTQAFGNTLIFLSNIHDAAVDHNLSDLSIATTRAFLAFSIAECGGVRIRIIPAWYVNRCIPLIHRTLNLTQPSDADLALLQKDCQDLPNYLLTVDCIRLDRAATQALLEEAKAGVTGPGLETLLDGEPYRLRTPWEPLDQWLSEQKLFFPSKERVYRKECIKHLRFHRQLIFMVQLPIEDQYSEWGAICDRELRMGDGQAANMYIARWEKVISELFDLYIQIRCIEAAIACERFRIRNGKWPEEWQDIVPSLLEKVPTDVRNHDALRLKRLTDGLVIYGLRATKEDHGGDVLGKVLNEGNGFQSPKDIGFRLFDPAVRRQPAPPKPKKTPSPE